MALTGQAIVDIAKLKEHQEYYWTKRPDGTTVIADYDNANYGLGAGGGWDCAELVSYCAFQAYGKQLGLSGGVNGNVNAVGNEAWTGHWLRDAANTAVTDVISMQQARYTAGAILVIKANGSIPGHIVISVGDGTNVIHATAPTVGGYYTSDDGTKYLASTDPKGVDIGDVVIGKFNWSSTEYVAITLDGVSYKSNGTANGDTIPGMLSSDSMRGYDGNDSLAGQGGNDSIWGDSGNDTISGGDNDDSLRGGNENDSIYGDAHNDRLDGEFGHDRLFGGSGNDDLFGGEGNDTIDGGSGNDYIDGYAGTDTASFLTATSGISSWLADFGRGSATGSSSGTDILTNIANVTGTNFNDSIGGNKYSNTLTGASGRDTLRGYDGSDILIGDSENDLLMGDSNNDSLYGGTGLDSLQAGSGDDFLFGGNDADSVSGESGNDELSGGSGSDNFFFYSGGGTDRIKDFYNNVDTLMIDNAIWGGTALTVTQLLTLHSGVLGSSVYIWLNGVTIVVEGITSTSVLLDDITII